MSDDTREPCVVCGELVEPGEGCQALGPFPALHSRCAKGPPISEPPQFDTSHPVWREVDRAAAALRAASRGHAQAAHPTNRKPNFPEVTAERRLDGTLEVLVNGQPMPPPTVRFRELTDHILTCVACRKQPPAEGEKWGPIALCPEGSRLRDRAMENA